MKRILLSMALALGMITCAVPAGATVTSPLNKVTYAGDSVTSVFAFAFNVYASTDLVLTKVDTATGIETALTLNTDYTVSLTKVAPTTGSVTLIAGALPTGTSLVIRRVLPLTQQINISDYSPTPAATWNEGYDRGVMLSQQIQEQASRAIVQSVTATSQITFPSSVDGQCIGWSGTSLSNLSCAGGGGGSGFNPPIPNSQIQTITTAGKVSGAALTLLPNIPLAAGSIPIANIPTIPDSSLSAITTAGKVDGSAMTNLANIPIGAGTIPTVNLPSTISFKTATLARDLTLGSNSVAYTGIGFKPSAIIFLGSLPATKLNYTGFYDGTTNRGVATDGTTGNTGPENAALLLETSTGNYQLAVVASLDSDGFTLTWTKIGSPGGVAYFQYLAIK